MLQTFSDNLLQNTLKKNSLCLSFQIEWGLRKAFPYPLRPLPNREVCLSNEGVVWRQRKWGRGMEEERGVEREDGFRNADLGLGHL